MQRLKYLCTVKMFINTSISNENALQNRTGTVSLIKSKDRKIFLFIILQKSVKKITTKIWCSSGNKDTFFVTKYFLFKELKCFQTYLWCCHLLDIFPIFDKRQNFYFIS